MISNIVRAAYMTGSMTLAAVAFAHPVGAAGGAIFAVSNLFCGALSSALVYVLIPTTKADQAVVLTAKIAAVLAFSFFGGWKLAALFGVNMSLTGAAVLTIYAIGIGVGIDGVVSIAYDLGKSLLSTDKKGIFS